MCYDILEEKNPSQSFKNKKFKHSKNSDFLKEANPWFWWKKSHYSIFFLGNIDQDNVYYDTLEQKKPRSSLNKQVQTVEKLKFFHRG